MIRIAIIDSQAEYRKKLDSILALETDFKVIGSGKDGYEAVRIVDSYKPDIVLLDIEMPFTSGFGTASLIKSRSPATSIIVFSDVYDERHIIGAFSSGVSGYVTKKTDPDFLYQSIRTVYRGGSLMSPEIAARASHVFSEFVHDSGGFHSGGKFILPKNISCTELRIMGCIGQGLANREIADRLGLREGTVRNCISSVLQKTGLRDRTQIAIFSIRRGL